VSRYNSTAHAHASGAANGRAAQLSLAGLQEATLDLTLVSLSIMKCCKFISNAFELKSADSMHVLNRLTEMSQASDSDGRLRTLLLRRQPLLS
jgi:hypothetical protein